MKYLKHVLILCLLSCCATYARAATVQRVALTNRVPGVFQNLPKAALNTQTGQTLVVWSQHNGQGTRNSLWGHLIESDGSPTGGSFNIIKGPLAQKANLIYNPATNSFVLVYQNDAKRNHHFAIFAVRLNESGRRLGRPVRVSEKSDITLEIANLNPRVVYDFETDAYVILWSRNSLDSSAIAHEGLYGAVLNADLTVRQSGVRLYDSLREGDNLRGPVLNDLSIHPATGNLVMAGYVIQDFQSFTWSYFTSSVDLALQKPPTPLATLNPIPSGGAQFDVRVGLPEVGGKPFAVFVDRTGLQRRLLTKASRPLGPVTPFFNAPVQNTKVEFPEVMTLSEDGQAEKFVIAVEVNVIPEKIWLQSLNSKSKASGDPIELDSSTDRILNPFPVRLPSTPSNPFRYAVIYTEGSEKFPPVDTDSSGLILLTITFTP